MRRFGERTGCNLVFLTAGGCALALLLGEFQMATGKVCASACSQRARCISHLTSAVSWLGGFSAARP